MESQKLMSIVMEKGLSGFTSEAELMTWANELYCVQHPLVLKRLDEIRRENESQMNDSDDDSVLYHAQSHLMVEAEETEMEQDHHFDDDDSLYRLPESQILLGGAAQPIHHSESGMDDNDDYLLFHAQSQTIDDENYRTHQDMTLDDDHDVQIPVVAPLRTVDTILINSQGIDVPSQTVIRSGEPLTPPTDNVQAPTFDDHGQVLGTMTLRTDDTLILSSQGNDVTSQAVNMSKALLTHLFRTLKVTASTVTLGRLTH